MVLRIWHIALLGLATVLLAWLVLPAQPVLALVALVGDVTFALLFARARGIQLDVESQIRKVLEHRDREREEVEAERRLYLECLRGVQRVVAEQHRVLADLVQEIDHRTVPAPLLEPTETPVAAAESVSWEAPQLRPASNEPVVVSG